ncbi:aminoacyl-tRNA hydrolase [Usitatibacter palustris]|uniref:Peptidyl-tRNA hydrolase n=1 Tax=Usitatibacter palustris TaxID=2732487 RepID=A0A6M4H2U9_9PROT|nr:aminoacyl-tRNA hydrolase [Usitatibacter palustris]QJR13642.1 Peptidyl-tRNA hydrolase [Usitatibacter palustris]
MDPIRLIVGLGNPGREYERTRHNAGFWWVDAIAESKRTDWKKETKFAGHTAKVEEGGRDFWLLKPATYMNESGRSVAALMRFYRIEPGELLVVHDELDLPPGTIRLKKGGGTGGHNGLTDIGEVLGTKDFWRLRIGIGHPGDKDRVPDYVLEKARREEQAMIDPAFDRSLELLTRLTTGRLQDAMSWLHTSPEDEAKRKAALEARAMNKEPKQ